MTMTYRAAVKADAAACAQILGDWFTETPYVPRIHTSHEDNVFLDWVIANQAVQVAVCENKIAGFLARDAEDLNLLYVRSDQTGLGIGTVLLDHAKSEAERLVLWTFQANKGAQRFYGRSGFRLLAETDGAGNEEKTPDLQYEWRHS